MKKALAVEILPVFFVPGKFSKLFPKTEFRTSPIMKRFKAAGRKLPNPYRQW